MTQSEYIENLKTEAKERIIENLKTEATERINELTNEYTDSEDVIGAGLNFNDPWGHRDNVISKNRLLRQAHEVIEPEAAAWFEAGMPIGQTDTKTLSRVIDLLKGGKIGAAYIVTCYTPESLVSRVTEEK